MFASRGRPDVMSKLKGTIVWLHTWTSPKWTSKSFSRILQRRFFSADDSNEMSDKIKNKLLPKEVKEKQVLRD